MRSASTTAAETSLRRYRPDVSTEPETYDESDVDSPLPVVPGDAEWLTYEKDVAKSLASMDPNAKVTHNLKRKGISGRKRQLDALIVGEVCGTTIEIAVEAKKYSKTLGIGIGVVDAFVGKCIDVGVNQGILYSHMGFGAGAKARAASATHPKIELRELPKAPTTVLTGAEIDLLLAELEPWEAVMPKFLGVEPCPGAECYGEFVAVEDWDGGICDQCGFPVGMCQECGSATRLDSDERVCDNCDAGAFDVEREHGSGVVTHIHWMTGL